MRLRLSILSNFWPTSQRGYWRCKVNEGRSWIRVVKLIREYVGLKAISCPLPISFVVSALILTFWLTQVEFLTYIFLILRRMKMHLVCDASNLLGSGEPNWISYALFALSCACVKLCNLLVAFRFLWFVWILCTSVTGVAIYCIHFVTFFF